MKGKLKMSEKVEFEQFAESQEAIREYIHNDENHWGTHEATVRVTKANNIVFNEILSVVTLIETNESFVEIIWSKEYEDTYYIKYSNQYQEFKYYSGVLEIRCQNKFNQEIVITIE